MEYAEMSKKMIDILGLKYEPVAVTLIHQGQPFPSGYMEPETPVRHCQSIMRARKGEMLLVPAKKHSCPVGSSALGLSNTPDKIKSGEFHFNIGMYDSPEAAERMIAARPHFEVGEIIATVVSPLSKALIVPDVVIVTGTPEQVYWIVPAATTFSIGGRVTFETAPFQASCVDSTIIPYQKGIVNASLGCFGCRKYTDIAPEEMLVGIPMKRMEELVNALERLAPTAIAKGRAKA